MTEFVFVKPVNGGRVRMPDRNSTVMPAEGHLVPRIDYYERLIVAGDLTLTDAPTPNDLPVEQVRSADPAPRAQPLDRPADTSKGARK
jgi:Protein of unknown function (DUF2635)